MPTSGLPKLVPALRQYSPGRNKASGSPPEAEERRGGRIIVQCPRNDQLDFNPERYRVVVSNESILEPRFYWAAWPSCIHAAKEGFHEETGVVGLAYGSAFLDNALHPQAMPGDGCVRRTFACIRGNQYRAHSLSLHPPRHGLGSDLGPRKATDLFPHRGCISQRGVPHVWTARDRAGV